jgi:hypothetical protein
MAKLTIPKSNAQEKAVFAKLNITLRESMTEQEFEAVAAGYLSGHNVLHLATCRDNEPRSTPLEYFNNGLMVYSLSEGGGKFANLKVNQKVSFSISDPYDPFDDYLGATGMQVWGSASSFKKNDDLQRFKDIYQYSRNAEALRKHGLEQMAAAVNFNIIIIEPRKISYLNLRQGFRNVIWTQE